MKRNKLLALLLAALLLFAAAAPAFGAEGTSAPAAPVYVVLGDSIGYGSGLRNAREACYGRIVADTNGYAYANDAVPGHTTGNLLARLRQESVRADVAAADIISLSIGGNNFLLGNIFGLLYDGIVREDYSRFDEIAAGYYADLCTIIDEIRSLNPDAVILLQTLYNPQTGAVGEVYQQGVNRINAAVAQYDAAHPSAVVVVPVGERLTAPSDFAADSIHPSRAGNEKIAALLLETLAALELGTETTPVINVPGEDIQLPGGFTDAVNGFGRLLEILAQIRSFFLRLFPFLQAA